VNRALWFLLFLQFRGWWRKLWNSLRTVKGALLVLLGASVFGLWILSVLLTPAQAGADPDTLRRYGPTALLVYCFLSVILSRGERGLYFSPAEINLLFSGPFGRRQLLGYKIASSALVGLPTTLVLTLILQVHARWFLAAFLGLFLAFLFLQLFLMAINLIAITLGAQAYTLGRKLLVVALVLLLVVVLFQSKGTAGVGVGRALFHHIESNPVWRAVAAPLGVFVELFVVEPGQWTDLLYWGALSVSLLGVLVLIVFLLDAQYLESAASASERIYARIQRMRRGEGGGLDWKGGLGKRRLGLPDLPWWGGLGPVVWRQGITALRSLGRLALFTLILGPILVGPLLAGQNEGEHETLPFAVLGMLIWLTVVMTSLVPFDFRGDLERMEVLKTLPLPAWRLSVGQLVVPVVVVTLVQALLLAAVQAAWGRWDPILASCLVFAPPVNFLVFGLDNLLFLWFPSKVVAANPGDFQALGRNVLVLLTKVGVLLVAGGIAAGLGAVVWLATKALPGALATGWLILTLFAAALVPVIALAFRGFDVSRDMPA
jgi:Putative ABC exporter